MRQDGRMRRFFAGANRSDTLLHSAGTCDREWLTKALQMSCRFVMFESFAEKAPFDLYMQKMLPLMEMQREGAPFMYTVDIGWKVHIPEPHKPYNTIILARQGITSGQAIPLFYDTPEQPERKLDKFGWYSQIPNTKMWAEPVTTRGSRYHRDFEMADELLVNHIKTLVYSPIRHCYIATTKVCHPPLAHCLTCLPRHAV